VTESDEAEQAHGPDGSDTPASPDAVARTPRFEILIAVMLGVAALLTASAAYLGDRDDGLQLKYLEQASQTQSEANDAFAQGDREKALDQTIFIEYSLAVNQGNNQLAAYMLRFSPGLEDAIATWAETDLLTPFSGDNPPYYPAAYVTGEELQTKADDEFAQGDFYDKRGDVYVVATVLFAISLALLGVASVIWFRRWRNGLTIGGGAFMLVGVVVMVTNGF
jgi:hypothetical protein